MIYLNILVTIASNAHVSQNYPTSNYKYSVINKVGVGTSSGINRTYMSFDLPELSTGSMVTYAGLYSALYSDKSTASQIDVHKVLDSWSTDTLTWNNKPSYNSIIEDYQIVQGVSFDPFYWNITDIVKEWYSTGINNGLMLKNNDETTGYTELFSSDTSLTYETMRPFVYIHYTNNSGLESYWTYRSQGIGRAGTGFINDYNGNLILIHNDLNTTGNRMPITINHVYNSNDRDKDIGYGNGWRLNYSQKVEYDDSIGYYLYTDEDGTIHYFKYDSPNTYKDESGINLTLTVDSGSTLERYKITDKGDNQLSFNSSGDLSIIKDNNGNQITLGYEGTNLTTITDGASRVTTLNYVDGKLSSIVDPSNRSTIYNYESDKLTSITYSDSKTSTYTYDARNNLTSVTNFDGYKMVYSYYDVAPYRVKKVQESNTDATLGQELNIDYGYNVTTFSDYNGRKTTYQFNNSGNTVSIKDDNGHAQYYKYIEEEGNNKNRLSSQSKLQKVTINHLLNHSAESTGYWNSGVWAGSTGTNSFTAEDKYIGNKSLKVEKTNTISRHFYSQELTLEKGKTYTLSGYVKTSNISSLNSKGASLHVAYQDNTGAWKYAYSDYISGTNDWERHEVTFTIPADATSGSVYARAGIIEETGIAYFDALQLEEGKIANRYNIVENPDFKYGTDTPTYWTKNSYTDSSDTLTTITSQPASLDNNAFKFNGAADKDKKLSQTINISGDKDDTLIIGGWAKGDSVPLTSERNYAIKIGIHLTTGSWQYEEIQFNEDSSEWQYISDVIVTSGDYDYLTYNLLYYDNANTAYFDGLQLYKESFSQSFTYDADGNITSIDDLAEQRSTFNYDTNNDLIKYTDQKGFSHSYKYDNNHNVITATSAENIENNFEYDQYGNPINVIVENGNNKLDNHNFETDSIWSAYNSADSIGSASYSSSESYLGTQSYKITKSNDVGYHTVMDIVGLEKGKTYTFSGYVKADNLVTNNNKGAQLYVAYQDEAGAWKKEESIFITNTNGLWQRLSVTFTIPQNSVSNEAHPKFTLVDASGTVYFDSLQLEEGTTATEYSKYIESQSTYTTNGNYTNTVTDPSGNTVTYNIDETKGTLNNYEDAKGNTTSYQYDSLDRLLSVSKEVDGQVITNSYIYDKDRIQTITHNGFSYSFGYDSLGNNTTVDVGTQNLITNIFEPRTSKHLESQYGNGQTISYDYDNLDRLTAIKYNSNERYRYQYDASGNLGYHEDLVNGTSYRYIYDLADRLAKVEESNGDSITYGYDQNNNYSNVTERISNNSYTTSFDYDKDNRPTKVTTHNNKVVDFSYDTLGRLQNQQINTGSTQYTTSYNYHEGANGSSTGQIESIDNNGAAISYTYDRNGNIETIKKAGEQTKYYYNELNELVKEETRADDGLIAYYSFDNNDITDNSSNGNDGITHGSPTFVDGISGKAIEFDGIDDWVELTDFQVPESFSVSMWVNPYTTNNQQAFIGKHSDTGDNQFLVGYWLDGIYSAIGTKYNAQGEKTTGYYHLTVTVTKDDAGHSTIKVFKNGAIVWEKQLSNVIGITNGKPWVLGQDWDPEGLSDFFNGALDEVAIYDHDLDQTEINSIYTTGVNVSPRKTTTYSYDQGGNILSKAEYDYITGPLGTPTKTYVYAYGDANWKDKLTSFDGKAITYDAIGNPLTYNGYSYTWEQGRQLAGITGNGLDISFKYNDSGIRTEKTVNGVTTSYRVVGSKVTYETNGTDETYYTYDSTSYLLSMNLNGVEYYYIRNAQGDIIGLIDDAGTEVVTYSYDSWGKLISIDGSLKDTVGTKNPYRYRGYRYDSETGLYYLQSRYYNPEWGRFINADTTEVLTKTLTDLTDKNLFSYCDNNPITREDSDGDFWGQAAFAGVGALGTAWSVGGANFWNPVGWTILGVATVATVSIVGYKVYKAVKSKEDPDPYARPNQKKQGRERKEKKRANDNWKSNPNKKPAPLKKHTPGRGHSKY